MTDLHNTSPDQPARGRGKAIALAAGGLVAGGVLGGTLTATAATTEPPSTPDSSTASEQPEASSDQSLPQRSDEELLTGELLQQVTDAALAEYPGATIVRVETDSDGVYEAHLTTADGEPVTVEVDEDMTVTGVEAAGGGAGHRGGPGGPRGELPPDDAEGTASEAT